MITANRLVFLSSTCQFLGDHVSSNHVAMTSNQISHLPMPGGDFGIYQISLDFRPSRGLFLESRPENFSGPKSQSSNCNLLILKR